MNSNRYFDMTARLLDLSDSNNPATIDSHEQPERIKIKEETIESSKNDVNNNSQGSHHVIGPMSPILAIRNNNWLSAANGDNVTLLNEEY